MERMDLGMPGREGALGDEAGVNPVILQTGPRGPECRTERVQLLSCD